MVDPIDNIALGTEAVPNRFQTVPQYHRDELDWANGSRRTRYSPRDSTDPGIWIGRTGTTAASFNKS